MPTDPDFKDALIGKYHFRQRLGSGGAGVVYLADQLGPSNARQRSVAIKVFLADPEDRSSVQRSVRSFDEEVKLLIELASTSAVVTYYDWRVEPLFIDAAGTVFTVDQRTDTQRDYSPVTALLLVMELADASLSQPRYRAEMILQSDNIQYLDNLIDVCRALETAHSKDIVHRDIKPDNLLWFQQDRRVKIADFGIGLRLGDFAALARAGLGTPQYMAPESFQGAHDEKRRDIYALGCTFYEVFTGSKAFPSPLPATDASTLDLETQLQMFRDIHQNYARPDAVVYCPEGIISITLSNLLKRMMAVQPKDRPALDEVVSFLQSEKKYRRQATELLLGPDAKPSTRSREPVVLSSHNINPRFRLDVLKERLYFLFIRLDHYTDELIDRLLAVLEYYFGDTASVYEVFGEYDILVRAWATPERAIVERCCKFIMDKVLDKNPRGLRVMVCDDIAYLGSQDSLPDSLDAMATRIRLNEAQQRRTEATAGTIDAAARWLERQHIYCRKKVALNRPNMIKCFCRLFPRYVGSEDDRKAQFALIKDAIAKSVPRPGTMGLSIYRRAFRLVEGVEMDEASYMIRFIAPSYDRCVDIPGMLLESTGIPALRTSTLLATKRLYIESDRVLQR